MAAPSTISYNDRSMCGLARSNVWSGLPEEPYRQIDGALCRATEIRKIRSYDHSSPTAGLVLAARPLSSGRFHRNRVTPGSDRRNSVLMFFSCRAVTLSPGELADLHRASEGVRFA